MSFEITEASSGPHVEVTLTGTLTKESYDTFVPEMEQRIAEHGKLRLVVVLKDFHGWNAAALWEDAKFDWKHFGDFERIAFVGETRWQHGMALFCKPFTTASLKYFDADEIEAAREWVRAES